MRRKGDKKYDLDKFHTFMLMHCKHTNAQGCYDSLWHMMNPEFHDVGVSIGTFANQLDLFRMIAVELPLAYFKYCKDESKHSDVENFEEVLTYLEELSEKADQFNSEYKVPSRTKTINKETL